jgi:hypothetical protein
MCYFEKKVVFLGGCCRHIPVWLRALSVLRNCKFLVSSACFYGNRLTFVA